MQGEGLVHGFPEYSHPCRLNLALLPCSAVGSRRGAHSPAACGGWATELHLGPWPQALTRPRSCTLQGMRLGCRVPGRKDPQRHQVHQGGSAAPPGREIEEITEQGREAAPAIQYDPPESSAPYAAPPRAVLSNSFSHPGMESAGCKLWFH